MNAPLDAELDPVMDQLVTLLASPAASHARTNAELSARLHSMVAAGDPLAVAAVALQLCIRGEQIAPRPSRLAGAPIGPVDEAIDSGVRSAIAPWTTVVSKLELAHRRSREELARLRSTRDRGQQTRDAIQIHEARVRLVEEVLEL